MTIANEDAIESILGSMTTAPEEVSQATASEQSEWRHSWCIFSRRSGAPKLAYITTVVLRRELSEALAPNLKIWNLSYLW